MTDHSVTNTDAHVAVLFADIAGSTRLYETLGDQAAKSLIDNTIARMSELVLSHAGVVVKTIGDEVMSRFPSADAAVQAARALQEATTGSTVTRPRIALRIGLHWGPALLDRDDVFGDAVNVAARMTGVARAGQVITTGDTVQALSSELAARTRLYDRAQVKGKQAEIDMYEVLWEQGGAVTTVVPVISLPAAGPRVLPLELRQGEYQADVPGDGRVFTLGRSDSCDFVVQGALVSREHARIEYRRGKFILVDQSSNGTWVRTEDGTEVYLRREELPLWGEGVISLGDPIGEDGSAFVHFRTPSALDT